MTGGGTEASREKGTGRAVALLEKQTTRAGRRDPETDALAPRGQLVIAGVAGAQLGLDRRAYEPVRTQGASGELERGGEGAQPPLSGEAANRHLGLYTRFPGSTPTAPEGAGGQLELPLPGRWDRHAAQLDLFDTGARFHPDTGEEIAPRRRGESTLGPYLGPHTRIGKCEKVRREKGSTVTLERSEHGAWRTTGMVICNTWQCAACGARRARDAAALLSTAIPAFRALGEECDVWLLTPTIWHRPDEPMESKLDRLFEAWDALMKSAAWERFAREFSVRAVVRCLDETFWRDGREGSTVYGFHPHFHALIFVERAPRVSVRARNLEPSQEALELEALTAQLGATYARMVAPFMMPVDGRTYVPMATAPTKERTERLHAIARDYLVDAWCRILKRTGVYPTDARTVAELEGARELVDVGGGKRVPAGAAKVARSITLAGGNDAARYVVKWGLADEAVRSSAKQRSHGELLNRYVLGDVYAGKLYREWSDATRGRHFATGLGDVRELLELTDEDIEAHVTEMRRRRDEERARNGEPVKLVRPLSLAISPFLFGAAIAVGWRAVVAAAELADDQGDDAQRAVDTLLLSHASRAERAFASSSSSGLRARAAPHRGSSRAGPDG